MQPQDGQLKRFRLRRGRRHTQRVRRGYMRALSNGTTFGKVYPTRRAAFWLRAGLLRKGKVVQVKETMT